MLYCDTHVHSFRSFVGAPNMTLGNIAQKAAELGVGVVAITDHLMKPEDVEGLKATKRDIMEFNAKAMDGVKILYGVEVCVTGKDGSTLFTRGLADELACDVVIGGVHETYMPKGASLGDMVTEQCRHHIMLMENPLMDILVHPWWLDKAEFERLGIPWPDDLSFIPKDRIIELAHTSKATGTYIEISTMSGLCNKDVSERFRADFYDYYRLLYEEGALFAIGTDTHELSEMGTFSLAKSLIASIGMDEERLYRPDGI